jgi:hypothetical protein
MKDMFGFEACMESVKFDIEFLHQNPFELLGRWMIRAEQDVFFNKTMITALKQYIADHNMTWDA